MKEIIPTDSEIDEVLNRCSDIICDGKSMFPGMSYEEGVQNAIFWITGDIDENPLE
jgi:hypothetical protein